MQINTSIVVSRHMWLKKIEKKYKELSIVHDNQHNALQHAIVVQYSQVEEQEGTIDKLNRENDSYCKRETKLVNTCNKLVKDYEGLEATLLKNQQKRKTLDSKN